MAPNDCFVTNGTTKKESREEEETVAYTSALRLGCSTSVAMALKAVIELNVLEVIAAAGPGARLLPEEIVSQIETTNPNAGEVLDRLLRFLASYNVLKCEVVDGEKGMMKRKYGLAPICRFFTKDEDGVSVAPLLLMNQDKVLVDAWINLKYAVSEGTTPFVKAHGESAFQYHGKDHRFSEVFNQGMFNHTAMLMKKILETYKGFESLDVLVDVGGGIGATLAIILSKYPHIKAINFDLPFVISEAKPIPGVEFVGGDMFASVPTGDAIFMKWILHDWDDEHCVKILKNCREALPDNGKVIVVEGVIPEIPEDSDDARNGYMGDLCMLTYNVGGKERNEKEFKYLAKESGFSGFKIACCVYGFSVLEFSK
ncbi:caffeic acid 3-O-methyltransferase-like [Dioscorea cayenensis subsp. rotundata]|uniref:Caffeic acid 3-O-methyltransferase-like n=1 Tax=Dioscorea cayennensis subsp. rotundata TaxID=55577 RepID=A0AB40CUN5_DIOCR|nr:caffeic acid 3-O-methyltransferase-like [Dioscorea cayenensis subsp. rotundata]